MEAEAAKKKDTESLNADPTPRHEAICTRITSSNPANLSKTYKLKDDGDIDKKTSASMVKGKAERIFIHGLKDLSEIIKNLNTNQVLAYGDAGNIGIITRKAWLERGRPSNPIPRTKEHFQFQKNPGVLMLDCTDGGNRMSCYELVSTIKSAVPGLADAKILWVPSSSSHIYNARTNEDLTGLKGQRLYILVTEATDIPRAGEAIVNYLWAAGYGYIEISKAGFLLERCPVDGTVWQPNRLDFAAGAHCIDPLEQRRGAPEIIDGSVEFVDTASVIPDPDAATMLQANTNRTRAKDEHRAEAERVKQEWISTRVSEMLKNRPQATDREREEACDIARRAVANGTLSGDFRIPVMENEQCLSVRVEDVLNDPNRYNGLQTLDPLEPDYQNNKVVGKLYLSGSRPNLFSYAHGGKAFHLMRQIRRIEAGQGQLHDAVTQTLEILRQSPEFYDFGNSLVFAVDGMIYPLDEAHLRYRLGGIIQFWSWKRKDGQLQPANIDPPKDLCKEIIAMGSLRCLKPLKAVLTAPTMRLDGSLIYKPGYDQSTGLLLELSEESANIPINPSKEQVSIALEKIMHPFKDFPVVGPISKGILLAAVLTAVLRPVLPTAPAFGLDAPVQASGKTLMGRTIAALSTGEEPSIWPHTNDKSDEEARKRIFTALRSGARCIIWDNVMGIFDSSAIAGALTSSSYKDRVLGKSEESTVPNRALFILTGNNLCLAGDLPRRVLVCRIDPGTDRPFAREFDFDPVEYVLNNRQELAEAALTIIRGWLSSDAQRAPGRMASFEDWDDLVRQTVVWVGGDEYGDPMDAVDIAQSNDPEQTALNEFLEAWYNRFSDKAVTAKEAMDAVNIQNPTPVDKRLYESISDVMGDFPKSPKSLGRTLRFRKDRIIGGLRLEEGPETRNKVGRWRVVKVDLNRDESEGENHVEQF